MSRESIRAKRIELETLYQAIDDEACITDRIIRKVTEPYVVELDRVSDLVDKLIVDIKRGNVTKFSEMKLKLRVLELANAIYKGTDGLSILATRSAAAMAMKDSAYNDSYKQVTKGTVQDKTSFAKAGSRDQALMAKVLTDSMNILSAKLRHANYLLESIKKCISSRMVDKDVFRKETSDELDGDYFDKEEGYESTD